MISWPRNACIASIYYLLLQKEGTAVILQTMRYGISGALHVADADKAAELDNNYIQSFNIHIHVRS